MPPTPRAILEAVAAIGTVGSFVFYFLSALGLASFLSDNRKKLNQPALPASQLPPVSILKPLKGVDPEIWESFCSHCEQEYPEFQLIFGVGDPGDPAIEVVRKLQAKYPSLPIELGQAHRMAHIAYLQAITEWARRLRTGDLSRVKRSRKGGVGE